MRREARARFRTRSAGKKGGARKLRAKGERAVDQSRRRRRQAVKCARTQRIIYAGTFSRGAAPVSARAHAGGVTGS